MSEAELPLAMESYGFQQIHTGFVTVSLTPDNPDISSSLAYDMINASRQTELDSIPLQVVIRLRSSDNGRFHTDPLYDRISRLYPRISVRGRYRK